MPTRFAILFAALVAAGCSSSSPAATPDSGAKAPGDSGATAPADAAGQDTGAHDTGHVVDSSAPPEDAEEDGGSFDFACGGKTPCKTTEICCATPGASVTFACVAKASCAAADQITCDGPDECGGAAPVCCGVETTNGAGTYPNCSAASLSTTCTAASACNTHLGTSCTDTTSVILCHDSGDCADPANNMCCTFGMSSGSLTFCTNATTAGLGGGTCH